MMRIIRPRGVALAALAVGLLGSGEAASQRLPAPRPAPAAPAAPKFVPKFEALAETKLLMEGLNQANYRGLERILKDKPADADTWAFARGQALLIAETGNLLLLRPPRNEGRDTWMRLAMDLRQAAGDLARRAGSQDYPGSRKALAGLATSCNRCHQTFRVPVRIGPNPAPRDKAVRREAE
jgi:hypothetical protein